MKSKLSEIAVVSESGESTSVTLDLAESPEKQRDFLYKSLPKTGFKCVFVKKMNKSGGETTHHYWFKSRKAAIRFRGVVI